jgi:hypothetical protein
MFESTKYFYLKHFAVSARNAHRVQDKSHARNAQGLSRAAKVRSAAMHVNGSLMNVKSEAIRNP